MTRDINLPHFDVPITPEYIEAEKYVKSKKWSEALQEAQKEAREFIAKLRKEREVTPEMLKEIYY